MENVVNLSEGSVLRLDSADIESIAKAVGAVFSGGIWWKRLKKGFWWPLDFTEPVNVGRTPPKMKFWGYQHLNYSQKANSSVRYMFIQNIENYDMKSLKPAVRRNVRESLRSLEFRGISMFDEKEALQAAACWNDLVGRTNWREKMDGGEFCIYWKNLLSLPGHSVIGAFNEGRLVGWLTGTLLDNGNCYATRYASLKESFNLRVNNGLIYTFILSAKESGAQNVNFGLFIPDNPELDRFKENMGFKLTPLPAYTYINPVVKPFISRFFRREVDRLTGWFPDANRDAQNVSQGPDEKVQG